MAVTLQSLPHLDPMGRCKSLATLWPELPELVIAEFNNYWYGTDAYIGRYRHRRDAFHDQAKQGLPEPLHVGWEHEVFEVCLQSVLNDLSVKLWSRGEWSDEVIQRAADIAIPNVRMDIALELSRCARPSLARPRDVSDAVQDMELIDKENEVDEWLRIGYREEELLNDSFGTQQEITLATAYMGLITEDSSEEVKDVRIPFSDAGGAELWANVNPELADRLPDLYGGLVSASFYSGFTTQLMLLACHPVIAAAIGLRADVRLGSLQMLDQEGKAAVILRVWKSEAVDADIASCIYRLSGCDLLMRRDCFNIFSQQLQSRVMLVYRSSHQ